MLPIRVAVIGGGIVGLATALNLARLLPQAEIFILEKEDNVGLHQTKHNSGVVHSGVYYQPGSLKARLCVEGGKKLIDFCSSHSIPFRVTGKVIVANTQEEYNQIELLKSRAMANGVFGVKEINQEELFNLEPYARGNKSLFVPNTAIVDYQQVALAYADDFVRLGGSICKGVEVVGAKFENNQWVVESKNKDFRFDFIVNCAGLFSDRIAQICGLDPKVRILPFRGEYYKLLPQYEYLVKGLIYPTPNVSLPFLGVHFTSMINGGVEAGPNAVLALAREGYKKTDHNWRDMGEVVTFPGFWKLLGRYGKVGAAEIYRSLSKKAFVCSLQKLIPNLTTDMFVSAESGVRAQAVDSLGKLVDDFYFLEQSHALHVLNAPSPAATSSLTIGEFVANKVKNQLSNDL